MYSKDQLKRDPDIIVIGETKKSEHRAIAEAVDTRKLSTSFVYANLACYRKCALYASGLRLSQPAMYEVCLSIIDKDQNAAFPRGMDRHIARSAKQGRITYEQPVEFTFQ